MDVGSTATGWGTTSLRHDYAVWLGGSSESRM
jgi:hypothetical protein